MYAYLFVILFLFTSLYLPLCVYVCVCMCARVICASGVFVLACARSSLFPSAIVNLSSGAYLCARKFVLADVNVEKINAPLGS